MEEVRIISVSKTGFSMVCLTEEELFNYSLDIEDGVENEKLERHLLICTCCTAKLSRLQMTNYQLEELTYDLYEVCSPNVPSPVGYM